MKKVPLAQSPEITFPPIGCHDIGDFQYLVLLAVRALSPAATIGAVVASIRDVTGTKPNWAQTHIAVLRLAADDYGFVAESGTIAYPSGGRLGKTFMITSAGEDMIASKIAHMSYLITLNKRFT